MTKIDTNAHICFETLIILIKNKKKILSSTNIFSTYFPSLLKILAWFPRYSE